MYEQKKDIDIYFSQVTEKTLSSHSLVPPFLGAMDLPDVPITIEGAS